MVKQWSMDETQSWFQSRSASQEREGASGARPAERYVFVVRGWLNLSSPLCPYFLALLTQSWQSKPCPGSPFALKNYFPNEDLATFSLASFFRNLGLGLVFEIARPGSPSGALSIFG